MKLIGFSARKQGGKDTSAKFLQANAKYLFGEESYVVKPYYFGQGMKDFCVNFLNIPHDLVWGADADKNTETHLRWENLPHYCQPNFIAKWKTPTRNIGRNLYKTPQDGRPQGYMTVREVLQQVGEEMFLGAYPGIWVDYLTKIVDHDINYYQADVGVFADPRKPEQIQCMKDYGAVVFRLTRCPFPGDTHVSETALDESNYDWSNFDYVIDNSGLSIEETNAVIVNRLANHKPRILKRDFLFWDKRIDWNPA